MAGGRGTAGMQRYIRIRVIEHDHAGNVTAQEATHARLLALGFRSTVCCAHPLQAHDALSGVPELAWGVPLVLSAIFLVIYTARKCVLDIAALESAIEKEAVPAGSGSDGPAASSVESDQSQEAEIDEAALVEQKLAEEVWSEA